MKEEIKTIQKKLIDNLERLDNADENITEEVARSNAISQLANTSFAISLTFGFK